MDVYYIQKLRSSIVSVRQLDEHGCQVLIDSGGLRIRDCEHRLLAQVKRSMNWIYILDHQLVQPMRQSEEPWLSHGHFGHLNFDALWSLARADCDCLARKITCKIICCRLFDFAAGSWQYVNSLLSFLLHSLVLLVWQ